VFTAQVNPRQWSPRARLYGGALATTLAYLLIGRLSNENQSWVQVNLPLSALSILLLGLSAAEMYLFVQRIQRNNEELQAARQRELELSQRLAFQRQTILSQISRALIDRLDVNQMPGEVLERIAQLFEADVVATWGLERNGTQQFVLRGIHGLNAHSPEQLDAIEWSFPPFESHAKDARQLIAGDVRRDLPAVLAGFCEKERLVCCAITPIMRRDEFVGIIGVFYRNPLVISPSLAAEMQTVANVIAGAIQAEELYHDLIQVQKIESIGTLTSGIAHDFNNVLAAILACASYVKQQTDPASPTYRYLEATEASAHRGAALTKQLLSFVRREEPHCIVLNANECIEQTLKMLERSFDKNILIQRKFTRDLCSIEADASQLEQVVLNIAVNARDAMAEGGLFTITTRNTRLNGTDPYRPRLEIPDGDYVVLGFRDTGCGMDAATLKRVFEPFFTTKRPGKGTGLGMSVVQSVVKNFGGAIHVESEQGKGTFFEVFLPATSKPLPVAAPAKAGAPRGGHERILLAEDEDVIREMAQLELEARGYKVLTAADGPSALARYRQEWQTIDLVVADMVMPRMSGPELFAGMKKINPGVRVIVSSGYSHDQEGTRMLQHGCLGYLQKPYNAEKLNEAVRSVLDSGL
jgi:signal transduction histidine kinase